MPNLDVNDVLSSPEFADTSLVCIRRTQTVNSSGIAQESINKIPFTGVVTPDQGSRLNIDENGTRIVGSILITTAFKLRMDGQSVGADHVQWNGREYIVENIYDYSQYGRGFVVATCDIKPITGG